MSRTLQEQIDELKNIIVDLVAYVIKLEANHTILQENCNADYKTIDSLGVIVTDQQRINELHDITQYNPLIKSVFESSPLYRGGERIIDDSLNTQAFMRIKKTCEIPSRRTPTIMKPKRKLKKDFTPSNMSYDAVFEYLHSRNLLYPMGPTLYHEEDQKDPNCDKIPITSIMEEMDIKLKIFIG